MTHVLKWRRLGSGKRRLLGEALLWITVVRLGLWTLPFVRLERLLRRAARRPCRRADPVEEVVWAIRAASARVPRATCLTQGLAARLMLERRGRPATLRIGVARAATSIEAHAWLEMEGRIVIGESEPGRYGPLEAG